jgi:transposase-like protein
VAKRPRYDDKFRASAVVMLEAAGYPDRKGALSHVSKHLGVPIPTLTRWVTGAQNPAPNDLVTKNRIELSDLLDTELVAAFEAAKGVRSEASYRDLMTGIGILVDKRQLLRGEPTQTTNQRILVEYADDTDIVAQAASVAERYYQDGEAV